MYTRHILLFRRCRHKVQGKLLPSKMIVTGVDMGRSFSVLLFCVAMDPVLTYLNRIPGMLAVQGYVDDTTMVGDTTAGMQWLTDAWNICTRLRSAGIQIDEHHCWEASGVNMHGACSGHIDQHPLYNGREDYKDMLHCDKPLFTEQVIALPLLSAEPISFFVLPRQKWMLYWQEDILPRLTLFSSRSVVAQISAVSWSITQPPKVP